MAFNPLRGFRKHQKTWFAALTIMCMVTFVLCSGIGAGQSILDSFGLFGSRSKSEVVATLYGKDVYAREIQELRNQRRLANQYIELVTASALDQLVKSVKDASAKWEDPQKKLIETLDFYRRLISMNPQFRSNYLQMLVGDQRSQGAGLIYQLQFMQKSFLDAKKVSEARLIGDLINGLRKEVQQAIRPRNEFYFGGSTSLEDILDFMIWRHEADQRGIQLSPQDINQLVFSETGNQEISSSELRKVEDLLKRYRNFSPDTFRTALADEFRVRIAKTAITGGDRPEIGTGPTPYEFWNFYKDNRTENVVAVLPIPVRNKDFLDQVGQPTEKDLKELFEKYKEFEYQPGSDMAGFKVPPKIEVEWVSAKAESDLYRQKAARILPLIQAGFQVLAGSGQTLSGSIIAEALPRAIPFAFDLSLINKYELETYRLYNASWTSPYNTKLHDTSIQRAENVAGALGKALGAVSTNGLVLSALATYRGAPYVYEAYDRARMGTTMALAYLDATPFSAAALAYYGTPRSPYLPLSTVREDLIEKLQDEWAQKLVQSDLLDLKKKLTDASSEKPDDLKTKAISPPEIVSSIIGQAFASAETGAPLALTTTTMSGTSIIQNYYQSAGREALAAVLAGSNPYPMLVRELAPLEKNRNAIDEAVAKYGFQHGSTKKPEDKSTIGEDEGIKPLKEAYLGNPFRDPKGKDFGDMFFRNPSAYSPEDYPLGGGRSGQTPSFLYWKTNDKAAYVPTFEEVKDKLKDWWQFDKARELAKKEAEELKSKAQGQSDAERWLKDGTKHSEPMFLLDGVAGLVKPLTPRAGRAFNEYQRYEIPTEKIEYPPDGLEKELRELTEPGQVLVKSDRPKAVYYVMGLVKRTPPSEFAFYREYQTGPEMLMGIWEQETNHREKNYKELLEQLRQEARLKINEENREKVDEKNRSEES
jgi:hypothetical protein